MCPPGGGCLSFIYTADLPAAGAAYPPAMDEQPLIAGIFGLATRRMCGLRCRQRSRWSLTPPFHPYPPRKRAVIFCHTCPDVAAGFPLGCAVLFVARTFLSILTVKREDAATDLNSALQNYYFSSVFAISEEESSSAVLAS